MFSSNLQNKKNKMIVEVLEIMFKLSQKILCTSMKLHVTYIGDEKERCRHRVHRTKYLCFERSPQIQGMSHQMGTKCRLENVNEIIKTASRITWRHVHCFKSRKLLSCLFGSKEDLTGQLLTEFVTVPTSFFLLYNCHHTEPYTLFAFTIKILPPRVQSCYRWFEYPSTVVYFLLYIYIISL